MNDARWLAGALVGVLLIGCSATEPTPPPQLTILAASSLQSSLADLTSAWKTARPNTALVTSTGATSMLRMQIEQGARADVLLGADTTNAQALVDEEDAIGPVTPFAINVLTVIVPASNPRGIQTPADLAKPGTCVIAAATTVPINKYAEQLVANLAQRPDYGASFATAYEANVCSREDNVGAIVNKVSLDQGDAAIVYVTDAEAAQNIQQITVPADSNVTATYGGVVVKASSNATAASDFLSWLHGPAGQAVLQAHGFGAAP